MTGADPTGIGTQNLGSVFTTRTAGVGKLPPRPRRSRPENAVDAHERPAAPGKAPEDASGPSSGQKRAEARERPARSAHAAKEGKAATAAGDKQQIIVYLPVDLADRLRTAREGTGRTHLQLVTDALDAVHERLDNLLAAGGYVESRSSSLFGTSIQPISRRPGRRGTAQISLRPSADVRDVLDRLVEKHSAPNRSVLIEVALDAHLPPIAGR